MSKNTLPDPAFFTIVPSPKTTSKWTYFTWTKTFILESPQGCWFFCHNPTVRYRARRQSHFFSIIHLPTPDERMTVNLWKMPVSSFFRDSEHGIHNCWVHKETFMLLVFHNGFLSGLVGVGCFRISLFGGRSSLE